MCHLMEVECYPLHRTESIHLGELKEDDEWEIPEERRSHQCLLRCSLWFDCLSSWVDSPPLYTHLWMWMNEGQWHFLWMWFGDTSNSTSRRMHPTRATEMPSFRSIRREDWGVFTRAYFLTFYRWVNRWSMYWWLQVIPVVSISFGTYDFMKKMFNVTWEDGRAVMFRLHLMMRGKNCAHKEVQCAVCCSIEYTPGIKHVVFL